MIAILPAAGVGKRMREVTGGASKEMLRVDGRPVLDWVLDEAGAAECLSAAVVGSPAKTDLTEYVSKLIGIRMAYQDEQRGLAHAVACAGAADEAALVILPDTLFHPQSPCSRLAAAVNAGADVSIAVEHVDPDRVSLYGIVEFEPDGQVTRIVEKPEPGETDSRWAVAARYGFSAWAMGRLGPWVSERLAATEGEVDLTSYIMLLAGLGHPVLAIPTEPAERRWDCGSVEGYRETIEVLGP